MVRIDEVESRRLFKIELPVAGKSCLDPALALAKADASRPRTKRGRDNQFGTHL